MLATKMLHPSSSMLEECPVRWMFRARGSARFSSVRPTISVEQHVFTISDKCCRIVVWETPVGFEYRVLARPEKQMLGFGQCPRLDQALAEAVALTRAHETGELPRSAYSGGVTCE